MSVKNRLPLIVFLSVCVILAVLLLREVASLEPGVALFAVCLIGLGLIPRSYGNAKKSLRIHERCLERIVPYFGLTPRDSAGIRNIYMENKR